MRLFSFLIAFLLAVSAQAASLELIWDAVTLDQNGSPLLAAPKYRLYRKTSLEDFKPIAETFNHRWTWLTPSIGRATYRVTAFNNNGESGPSNELKIIVDRCPREDN